jgi:Ca2+-binding RTX toxin-like protein
MSILKVYMAPKGTAILVTPKNQTPGTSIGHMFFTISDGSNVFSFGFAPRPKNESMPLAPGQVYTNDNINYVNNPNKNAVIASKDSVITSDQFNTLLAFGSAAAGAPAGSYVLGANNVEFKLYYRGVGNSCVNFTWAALATIGVPTPSLIHWLPSNNLSDVTTDLTNLAQGRFGSPNSATSTALSFAQITVASGVQAIITGTGDTIYIPASRSNPATKTTVTASEEVSFQVAAGAQLTLTGDANTITEVAATNSVVVLSGSATDKLSFAGKNITGTTSSGPTTIASPGGGNILSWTDSNNIQYLYSEALGTLQIWNGAPQEANEFIINGFNLQAAETTGFDGITLGAPGPVVAPGTPSATAPSNPQASVNAPGDNETLTVYGTGGESYKVAATGNGASTDILSTGSDQLSLSSGSATVTIPVGQNSVTVTLIDPNAAQQAQTVNLTATALGDSASSNTLSVTFGGVAANVTPTNNLGGTSATSSTIRPGTTYNYTYYDSSTGSAGNSGSYNVTTGSGPNGVNLTNAGGNVVVGGAGNDTIGADGANNIISGNGGQDILGAGTGSKIYANTAVDLATAITQAHAGNASNTQGSFLWTLDGNDTLVGDSGNDAFFVGTGNNVVVMGSGNSYFMGGLDVTNVNYNWAYNAATATWSNVDWTPGSTAAPANYFGEAYISNGVNYEAGGGNDTIYGGSGNEAINLSNGNNYVDAGSGNDTIQAGSGQNTIFGGTGNDIIAGGGGSSYIDAESGNDLIALNGGSSTVYGGTGNSTIYSGDYDSQWATSESGSNNVLNAGDGNTMLYGSGGNDTLSGGTGVDTIYGGAGTEVISTGDGGTTTNATLVVAGNGNTTVSGGSGISQIFGGTGNDVLIAGNGGGGSSSGDFDYIGAGTGNTTITGGDGVDHIAAGATGDAVITIGNGGTDSMPSEVTLQGGNATVTGGNGVDYVFGGAGNAVINLGDGGDTTTADQAVAGSGNTTITAGAGVDNLFAGTGNDTMIAGSGTTVMYGGTGHTTYQINGNAGNVEITQMASGDTVTFGADVSIADITASTGVYTDSSGNVIGNTVILTLNQGGSVILFGGSISQATFANGQTVTFAQLLSPEFTIGNTTYASTSEGLGSSSGASTGNSAAGASAVTTEFSGTPASALTDTSSTSSGGAAQNLTLTGMADLTGTGNNVDDVITANGGNDTLIAGTANDTLIGGGVSDLYVVSAGSGTTTTIQSSTGSDMLGFTAGITLANLTIATSTAADGSLIVTLTDSQGGTVVIDGAINADGTSTMLDQIAFTDGSSASLSELLAQLTTGPTASTTAANVTLAGGIQNMSLTGSANVSATGNAHDNVISANSGNDTLIAGTGYDTLKGGAGHTTYSVDAADASVVIINSGSGDVLAFDSSVTESNLTTTSAVVNGQTVVTIADAIGTTVTIEGGSLNQVSFADGSTATIAQLLSSGYTKGSATYSQVSATAGAGVTTLTMTGNTDVTATANSGNDVLISNVGDDTLVAGTGSDTLVGGGVSDVYDIANGNQVTTIAQSSMFDTLGFGTGVTLADLSATATTGSGGFTNITLTNSLGGTIVIDGSSGAPVDKIVFADGSTGSIGEILAQATTGSTVATSAVDVTLAEGIQNMTLTGSVNITATGNELPDVIAANGGNDTLVAGLANDTLIGGAGTTTYDVSSGNDIHIMSSGANDVLNLGTGIAESDLTTTSSVVNGQTVITLANGQGGTITIHGALNTINFADGSTATIAQLLSPSYTEGTTLYSQVSATATGTIATVNLTGNANVSATANSAIASTLRGNSGNDTLISANGEADTLIGGDGNTTYQVVQGAGTTTIENSWSGDTLNFTYNMVNASSITAHSAIASDGSTTVTIGLQSGADVDILNYQNSSVDTIQFVPGSGANISLGALLAQATSGSSAATSAISVVMPEGVQHMTLTGSANITASGNDQQDVIIANSGNDTLIAGTANDTLKGGSGSTTYDVGSGSGNITILNSSGGDVLAFGTGISSANVFESTSVLNGVTTTLLTTGQGNTVAIQGGGLQNVSFADGTTTTLAALQGKALTSLVSIVMPAGITNLQLIGTADISGTGNNLADTITANSGNDTLIAGSGLATLVGGAGNDTFIVNNVYDVVSEQPNTGSNLVQTSVNFTLPANVQNIAAIGSTDLTMTGNTLGNTFTTNSGNDTIVSGGATDTYVITSETANTLIQDPTYDLYSQQPYDTIKFGAGINESDISNVSLSNVVAPINPNYYAETLLTVTFKNGGTTTVFAPGYANANALIGSFQFADGKSFSYSDLMLNYGTQSTSYSAPINETVTGSMGNDTLVGPGGDTIIGGLGNDYLTETQGSSSSALTNAGGDTFVFRKGDGQDTVAGFGYTFNAGGANSINGGNNYIITPLPNTFQFGPGIVSGDISLVDNDGVFKIVTKYGDSITLTDTQYYTNAAPYSFNGTYVDALGTPTANLFTFADGSSLTWAQLVARGVTVYSSSNFTMNEVANSAISSTGYYQENLTLTGTAALSATGGNMASVITANSGNDILTAGHGLATLVGGSGSDTFVINNVADVIIEAANSGNNLEQSSVSTTLAANVQNLSGLVGGIILTGNNLSNVITDTHGGDTLVAGSGVATLKGAGSNTFVINNIADVIVSGGYSTVQTSVSYALPTGVFAMTGTGNASLTLSSNNTGGTITGNAGTDHLIAGAGSDTLVAGTGVTTMTGGAGAATFDGNNVAVTTYQINTGEGNITIASSGSNDVLAFGTGIAASSVTASATGSGSSEVVTLTVSGGNTVTIDDPYFTTVTFASGATTTLAALLGQTNSTAITSGASIVMPATATFLTLTGSADISATGNALADTILANKGNDMLIAGTGLATLVGGSGNDTFVINNSADVITEVPNSGNNTEQSSVSVKLADNVQNLVGIGTANISLQGNAIANVITANSGNDTLEGGGSNSTLVGGAGNDVIWRSRVAAPNTFVYNVGDGNMTIDDSDALQYVTVGSDVLQFGSGITAGSIVANAGLSYDTFNGNIWQSITLTLSTGKSVEIIDPGFSTIQFADGSTTTLAALLAQSGTAITSSANVTMPGGTTELTLTGTGQLTAKGNNLSDTMFANGAGDTLIAGSGLVTMVGGGGPDTFVINNASDVIIENNVNANATVLTSVSLTLPYQVANLTGTGSDNLALSGSVNPGSPAVITANSGNDTLSAGSNALTTLIGGAGNDILYGSPYSYYHTTFQINEGDGSATINRTYSGDTLSFGPGITAANIIASSLGSGSSTIVVLSIANQNPVILNNPGLTNVTFADGTTSTLATLIANSPSTAISSTASIVMPAGATRLTLTGTLSISGTGNNLPNIITANSGNDTLYAGSGIATLIGGSGTDIFAVNNTSDVITQSTANAADVVQSSASYTLPANLSILTGTGSANITLTGNTLTNKITANNGNDTLVAGKGVATLIGGAGNDIFMVNNALDVITQATANAADIVQTTANYTLPANLSILTGTGSAAIKLTGNTSADVITANSGNDTLTAGTGLATLIGGTGTDIFMVNSASDVITQATANAADIVQTTASYTLPANLSILTGTGSAALTLTGNSGTDVITGNAGNDLLVAGSGNDTLTAGTGSVTTTFTGGAGNDTFVINSTTDVVTAVAGSNVNTIQTLVSFTAPANVQNLTGTGSTAIKLTGNSGTDVITGNSGNDTLVAGSGSDTLIAGTGSAVTTFTGGAGNDVFVINNTADVVTAVAGTNVNTIQSSVSYTAPTNVQDLFLTGSGTVTATANSGNDLLIGNSGTDTLTGGSGVDVLEAGSGADVLKDTGGANAMIGGAGNDTMTGGTGASFLVGGAGNDAITLGAGTAVVAFNTGDGAATIAPGTGVANVLSLGGGIAYANLTFSKSGNNLILNTGGSNAITFTNWYAASADQNFVTLQVIEQAASTYSSSSTNVLYSSEVEEFSFTQLVAAFNTALAATPSLTSWSLSNALLTDHLSSSNTAALGGDLAYYEGLNGNLTGLNLATAVTTLQSTSFGKTAQTIDAWSGISNGNNKLH